MENTEKLTFKKAAEKALKKINKSMSANDLWKELQSLGLDIKIGSNGKTPWSTLASEISYDVKNNPNTIFYMEGEKPRIFGLKIQLSNEELEEKATITKNEKLGKYIERDLHPFLVNLAREKFERNVYCKTIRNEISKKGVKGANEWDHPDIVGFSYPFDMNPEILKMTRFDLRRFYSFELKKDLSMSVLREYYFQAVSNSSWANVGYLVVENIDWGSDETMYSKMQRLVNQHGIGIIQMNLEKINESKIWFQAKEKEFDEIDWAFVDDLMSINNDFHSFINDVIKDIESQRLVESNYDKYHTAEELTIMAKKMKGIA